jgi:mannosyltransferase OCH1-like enzyme
MFQFTNKRLIEEKKQEKIKQYQEKIKQYQEKIKIHNYFVKNSQIFILKENYNSVIPLNVYTCWHTKDLPPLMKQNYEKLISDNPKMNFHIYDENECREFIKTHFKPDVVEAYDSLIPCSYKSDLWRYCVLFINGGIYMDIKFNCVNNFRLITLTEKEHFVRDIDPPEGPPGGTLTGLIVCKKGNIILYNCIRKIVSNVQNKFYGINSLYPTGPGLLGSFFSKNEKTQMKMYFEKTSINGKDNFYICYNDNTDIIILKFYDEYREEQKIYQKNPYYNDLWNEKKIYNNSI